MAEMFISDNCQEGKMFIVYVVIVNYSTIVNGTAPGDLNEIWARLHANLYEDQASY